MLGMVCEGEAQKLDKREFSELCHGFLFLSL